VQADAAFRADGVGRRLGSRACQYQAEQGWDEYLALELSLREFVFVGVHLEIPFPGGVA